MDRYLRDTKRELRAAIERSHMPEFKDKIGSVKFFPKAENTAPSLPINTYILKLSEGFSIHSIHNGKIIEDVPTAKQTYLIRPTDHTKPTLIVLSKGLRVPEGDTDVDTGQESFHLVPHWYGIGYLCPNKINNTE